MIIDEEVTKSFKTPLEFVQSDYIQSFIEECRENRLTSEDYRSIVNKIIDISDISNKELLKNLFLEPSIISISSCRKYLRFKGQMAWNIYRQVNDKVYDNLFGRICLYLKNKSLRDTTTKFSNELKLMEKVTGRNMSFLVSLLEEYKLAYQSSDQFRISEASSNLKNLIKSFNSKSREQFVNNYIEENMEKVKSKFYHGVDVNKRSKMKIDNRKFLDMIMSDNQLRNLFRVIIKDKFDYITDNTELYDILFNILDDNHEENLDFFNLVEPSYLNYLQQTKSYNRLCNNYLNKIRELFNKDQIKLINNYLFLSSKEDKAKFKSKLKKEQIKLLEEIRFIVKEANIYFSLENDKISINTSSIVLSEFEEMNIKEYLKKYYDYKKICNQLYESYYKNVNNNEFNDYAYNVVSSTDIPFTDDNYILMDLSYLLKFEDIAQLIQNLDNKKIDSIDIRDYKNLKGLLINDGLLADVLFFNDDVCLISNIINNISSVNKKELAYHFDINRLFDIFRKTELFKYIDDFTLSLLGEDVAEKIIYDSQFLNGRNSSEDISLRLRKANDLMIRSQAINKSAIPYFSPIKIDNVSLERYNNNDSNILTSGIDSNTCFKISANDNDYLFYSILNKNGMVARIMEDGKMIGRITAHRLSNVLLINSVRSTNNTYQALTLDELEKNEKIVEVVKKFGKAIIDLTKKSDCPIDFVVSNKAGILEAPEYNGTFEILAEHLFTNPIDTYHDDFLEFRHLYDDSEQFLQQVIYFDGYSAPPFTTDYGNYPVVLIAAREGKNLNRRWDITNNSPLDIYIRNENSPIIGMGKLSDEDIKKIQRIDALNYFDRGLDASLYKMKDYSNLEFLKYEITDSSYTLVDSNGYEIVKSVNGEKKDNKRLIKKD